MCGCRMWELGARSHEKVVRTMGKDVRRVFRSYATKLDSRELRVSEGGCTPWTTASYETMKAFHLRDLLRRLFLGFADFAQRLTPRVSILTWYMLPSLPLERLPRGDSAALVIGPGL